MFYIMFDKTVLNNVGKSNRVRGPGRRCWKDGQFLKTVPSYIAKLRSIQTKAQANLKSE